MDDLISRKAVIELLKKNLSKDIEEVIVTDKNIKLIESMPCAYDVDAVVAELEEQWSDANCIDADMFYVGVCNGLADAISAVKRGGIE